MKPLRVALVCAVVLLASLWATGSAGAHAAYKDSDPADGEEVGAPPSRVVAEFTEPLAGGSELRVTDPCGVRVDLGDVQMAAYEMSVSMDASAAGEYVVWYRAHSQLDPHVTQGEFAFTVTGGESCAGAEPAAVTQTNGGGGGPGPADPGDPASGGAEPLAAGAPGSGSAAPSGSGDEPADGNSAVSRRRPSRVGVQRASVPNLAAGEQRKEKATSVWDGIRLEPFLTGLLLAAIIGAAGGKIYAGIMGPRS